MGTNDISNIFVGGFHYCEDHKIGLDCFWFLILNLVFMNAFCEKVGCERFNKNLEMNKR